MPSYPVLFISSTRLGDAVLSSGVLKRLYDGIRDARFTIAGGAGVRALFRDMPRCDDFIPIVKRRLGLHWPTLWRKVGGRRWGAVLDMRDSPLSPLLDAQTRAVLRPTRRGARPHAVIEAAGLLGLEADPPAPYLFTSAATEALADHYAGSKRPILAIAPGARWIGKTWPVGRFASLAHRLLRNGGPLAGGMLMVLGEAAEAPLAAPAAAAIPQDRVIDLVGRADPLTAFACLKRARLFIGADSGAMHLAAAAGAPTLGLFGPSDEGRYGPWGPVARVVRGPRRFEEIQAIDRKLRAPRSHMWDLDLDTVALAAEDLLAATDRRTGALFTEMILGQVTAQRERGGGEPGGAYTV
jgi:ADP-heptose:LPS heptosyltransferase